MSTLTFLKNEVPELKWQEILDNNDVNDDCDKFIKTFNTLYYNDESIPLKCTFNRENDPMLPLIT